MRQIRKGEVTIAMIVLTIALFALFTSISNGYTPDKRDANVTEVEK